MGTFVPSWIPRQAQSYMSDRAPYLFTPDANPCRCGRSPRIWQSPDGTWNIECGDMGHFYGLSRSDRAEAVTAWNVLLPSNKR